MTPAQKHNHALQFHRFQKSRESFYAPKYYKAIKEQIETFAMRFPYDGFAAVDRISSEGIIKVSKALSKDAVQVWGQRVRANLTQQRTKKSLVSFQVVANGGMDWLKDMTLKRMPIGFSQRILEIMERYFTIDIINNSEEITATTKEFLLNPRIQQLFIEAYQRGDSIDEIVRMFPLQPRARLIARTESVTAANKSALIVAKDTGLDLLKEWLATNDARTRDHHREMNGVKIPQDDYFSVKNDKGQVFLMDAPGDRGGTDGRLRTTADVCVNCRCVVIHEVIE